MYLLVIYNRIRIYEGVDFFDRYALRGVFVQSEYNCRVMSIFPEWNRYAIPHTYFMLHKGRHGIGETIG